MNMAQSEASRKEAAGAADAGVTVLLLDSPENEGVDFLQTLHRMGMKFTSERVNDKDSLFAALKKSHWDILLVNDQVTDPSVEETLSYLRQIKKETGYLLLSSVEITIDFLTASYKKGISAVVSSLHPDYSLEVFVQAAERSRRNFQLSQLNHEKFELAKHRDQLMSGTEEALAYLSDGIHVFGNDAYLKILGYTHMDNLINKPFFDIVSTKMREDVRQMIQDFQHAVHIKPDTKPMEIQVLLVPAISKKEEINNIEINAIFTSANFEGKECLQVLFEVSSAEEECDNILEDFIYLLRKIIEESENDRNNFVIACGKISAFATVPKFLRQLKFIYLALLADEINLLLLDIFDQKTVDLKKIKARVKISYNAIVKLSVLFKAIKEYQDSFELVSCHINELRVIRGKAAVFDDQLLTNGKKIKFHEQYTRSPDKIKKILSNQAFYFEKAAKKLLVNPKDRKAYLVLTKIINNMEKIFIECRFGTLWALARGVLDTTNPQNYLDTKKIEAVVALAKPLYLISNGDLLQLEYFERNMFSKLSDILEKSKKNTTRLLLIREWLLSITEINEELIVELESINSNFVYKDISVLESIKDRNKNSCKNENGKLEIFDLNQMDTIPILDSKVPTLNNPLDLLTSNSSLRHDYISPNEMAEKKFEMQAIGEELEEINTSLLSIIDGSDESLFISELQEPLNKICKISCKYFRKEYVDAISTISKYIQNNQGKIISADIAALLQTFCLLTSKQALYLCKGMAHDNYDLSLEIFALTAEISELSIGSFDQEVSSTLTILKNNESVSLKPLIEAINSVNQFYADADEIKYENVIQNLQILSDSAESFEIENVVTLASIMEAAYHIQESNEFIDSVELNELLFEAHVWLTDLASQIMVNKFDINSNQDLCDRLLDATTNKIKK